jgi:hypothetical protein
MLGPDGGLGVVEKLCEAVGALATGRGRVQERLSEAAAHLALIGRDELPSDELRPMLVAIMDALASAQLLDPLENLDDEEAVELARRILALHQDLERALRTHRAMDGSAAGRVSGAMATHAVRVMIRCPATGRAIATGLTADPRTWNAVGLNKVSCPECKSVHLWRRSEGYLEGGIGL